VVIDSRTYFSDRKAYTVEQDGDYYQWYQNHMPVPNSNTYFIDAVNQDDEYQVYIVKGLCYEFSDPALITAVDENLGDGLKIFPNPARDNFTIEVGGMKSGMLRIHDVTGRVVYEKKLYTNTSNSLDIPSVTWGSGVYIIILSDGYNTLSRKILVK
jgi:hypothetical protein